MADRIFPYGEAPDNAEYVVLEPNPDLPNAKELLAGTGISITVGADTVTISGDGSSAQTYITANDETATLPNSFQIIEGSNVTLDYVGSQLIISASVSGSGGGTVTIVNSGNANPLFTTNVTTATTTPTIAYTLTSAASATFFRGPASGAAGSPVYGGILGTDLSGALTAGTGITFTPATAPGSRLTISAYGFQPVSSTLNALSSSLSGTGYITQLGPNSFAERTFQDSTNITWTNPAGIAGNSSANVTSNVYTKNSSSLLNQLASTTPALGEVPMGASDGSYILTKPNAGTGIQMDFSNGVFTVSATGATGNSGTVTNVSAIPPAVIFNTSIANPTTTPAISFNITSAILQDLATGSGTGIVVSTDGIHHAYRQVSGTTGEINVTNPAGTAGNITLALDSSVYTDRDSSVLNALATGLTGTGFVTQNGAQFYDRTLTGTSNRLTITNPTGAAGDPVFDVGTDVLVVGDVTALPGIQIVNGSGTIQVGASGALGGTLTNLTVGDVSPVWITNVSTPTTTPAVTYTLNDFASGAVLIGPKTGTNAPPTLRRLLGEDIYDAVVAGSNITLALVGDQLQISSTGGGGSGTVTQVSAHNLPPLFTTNVATDTTTPDITFTLSNTASGTFLGGLVSGGSGAPTYRGILGTDIYDAFQAGANITITQSTPPNSRLIIALAGPINAASIADGSISNTEFQYLDGVTSNIQTQFSNKQPLDATLTALASYNTNGLITQTAADTFTGRTITGTGNRISITSGDGVSGNPTIDLGTDALTISTSNVLNDLASSTSTGIVVQSTSAGAHVYRTITGTANEITVTNGNGASGNPTLSLPTGIDVTKLANGSVDNSEFQFLNGVTSSIQTQLDGKLVSAGDLSPLFTTAETAGNIAFTLNNQASATFFSGPASGNSAAPMFRGILGTDLTGALTAGSNITITQSADPGSRLTIASTGGGYSTIQEEGSNLTQRTTMNFVGAAYTATDDSGNSRTNINAHTSVNSIAVTPTDGQIPIGNGTNFTVTRPIANYGVEVTAGSGSLIMAASGAMFNIVNTGRLTLVNGQPIADATSASTLYWCASGSAGIGIISLWDGTKYINVLTTQKSLSITATNGSVYDVFGYLSGGDLALETLVWTNTTTRATELSMDSFGVPYKSGDKTRRWLGSFYASGTNQCTDDTGLRGLYNTNNQVVKTLLSQDTTNSWTYTTAAFREINGGSTNGVSRVTVLSGSTTTPVYLFAQTIVGNSNSSGVLVVGAIGLDSSTARASDSVNSGAGASTVTSQLPTAMYSGIPGLGLHSLRQLEYSAAAATSTWYGDNGGSVFQTGMRGWVIM